MTNEQYINILEAQLRAYRRRDAIIKKVCAVILAIAFVMALPTYIVLRDHAQYAEWENTRTVLMIRVQSGDSVDGYWAEYAPEWMGREDYRREFKQLNDTDSCMLYEGQLVKVYMD